MTRILESPVEIHQLSMGMHKPALSSENAKAICCMDKLCPAHGLSMSSNRLLPHHSFRIGQDRGNTRTEVLFMPLEQ